MKNFIAIIFVSLLTITACSTSSSSISRVSADEFLNKISTTNVVVLDVRSPEEFATGHLPNAVNINVEAKDFEAQIANLDKVTTYGVYCRSGNRSGIASKLMAKAGFTSIVDSSAGLDELVANGAISVTK